MSTAGQELSEKAPAEPCHDVWPEYSTGLCGSQRGELARRRRRRFL